MSIINITDSNYAQELSSGVVLLEFYSESCGPCKMMEPVLKTLSNLGKFKICKVNAEENQNIASEYHVRNLPTIYILKDKIIQKQLIGVQSYAKLYDLLSEYINESISE